MATSLITGITTISAITLSDGWDSIADIYENVKEFVSWLHGFLPENKLARLACYSIGSIICLRLAPCILRKAPFFIYIEKQNRYFHRSTFHPDLLRIKSKLLKELKDNDHNLPFINHQLVLLEINAGGGTNLSYYPDGSRLLVTDHWEGAREFLEQNFNNDVDEPRIKLDRFIHTVPERLLSIPDASVSAVVCFHSLCTAYNPTLALLEMKRVLLPGGKVYFIEHVRSKEKYSTSWFWQLNFSLQMIMWDCTFQDLGDHIERAAFSYVYCNDLDLDLSKKRVNVMGPIRSLSPHIYGYAIK